MEKPDVKSKERVNNQGAEDQIERDQNEIKFACRNRLLCTKEQVPYKFQRVRHFETKIFTAKESFKK